MTSPPTIDDFLSQSARREPPPRSEPEFLERWRGLSVFDDERGLRRLGHRIGWRRGEFIAELHIPEGAPITYRGLDHKGHWLLYGPDGEMLLDEGASFLLGCVRRVVHGPSGALDDI